MGAGAAAEPFATTTESPLVRLQLPLPFGAIELRDMICGGEEANGWTDASLREYLRPAGSWTEW